MGKRVKGIVMGKAGKDTILLTPEGEFLRLAARRSHIPGMEVEAGRPRPLKFPFLWTAAAAVFAISLALYSLLPFLTAPRAYLAVDINPSLVFGLDRHAVVIEATALNADGERILETLAPEGRDACEVLEDLLQAAYRQGYLSPGRSNIIILSLAAAEGYSLSERGLRSLVTEQLLPMGVDTYLMITRTGLDKVKAARQGSVALNALILAEAMKDIMEEDEIRPLLKGEPPLPVRDFLRVLNPADIFDEKELVKGEAPVDGNPPRPGREEKPGEEDPAGLPVELPPLPRKIPFP